MTRHNSIAFQNRIGDCRAQEMASFSHHYQYFFHLFDNKWIIMQCETLLRLSIEEVNFTSVQKTNIALSGLKTKQLQWTTTVCKNCVWHKKVERVIMCVVFLSVYIAEQNFAYSLLEMLFTSFSCTVFLFTCTEEVETVVRCRMFTWLVVVKCFLLCDANRALLVLCMLSSCERLSVCPL